MDLFEAGLETKWEIVPLKKGEDAENEEGVPEGLEEGGKLWDGVKRRYWVLGEYKLPVCQFLA